MDEGTDNRNEDLDTLEERLTSEHIARVDAKYFSPKERASKVNTVLAEHDFTRWDYLCFAVEFLGQFTISYFKHDVVLSAASKILGKWLYNMHYFFAENVYGPPEEGERK